MEFYLYSIVLPIIIIAIVFWFHRPLKINNISKALIRSFIPLSVYILLVYFLEMENYIDSSWAFYSLIIFFIVYIIISIVLKIVLKQKKL
jgi:heme/copper-type cytochrome/quinol oxidase subunit 4